MTTNVPDPTFTATGLVLPEESAILAGVQADYDDAFGGDLNPALNTPQGQLASSTSAIVAQKNTLFAEFVNQVNPDTADGFMQDAIARIYFLNRSPGAPTSVICQCGGVDGTIIPAGSQAQDTSGNRYVATIAGTIASGTVEIPFAHVVNGPIACPADTLTQIYQSVAGWDTITNDDPGTVGHEVETQAEFAYRRQQSVALNAHGSLPSIYAAVFAVPDVIDVYATENVTNATVPTGSTSFPLVAHSLYVAAVGGDPQAIAEAIWLKKDVGCNYNGNTTLTVVDSEGYSPPYPSYTVKYEIPDPLPILFAVEIAAGASVPADIVAQTKAAIIATFTGADGRQRARIGASIFAGSYYAGVAAIGPTVNVLSILLGSVTPTLTSLTAGIDEAPTIDAADIDVTLV